MKCKGVQILQFLVIIGHKKRLMSMQKTEINSVMNLT